MIRPLLCSAMVFMFGCNDAVVQHKAATPPQKIVTLSPHLTEYVYWLGAGDRLVGTVAYADYPPQAKKLPRVGDAFKVNYERLLQLSPDLVLAWQGGNNALMIQQIRRLGLRVEVLSAKSLPDLTGQAATIALLLQLDVAKKIAKFSKTIEKSQRTVDAENKKHVFIQFGPKLGYTVGAGDMMTQLLSHCGAVNAFADVTKAAFKPSKEALATRRIDVVLVVSKDIDKAVTNAAQKVWNTLRAHQQKRPKIIATEPDWISRPGPRMLFAIQDVCKKLGNLP